MSLPRLFVVTLTVTRKTFPHTRGSRSQVRKGEAGFKGPASKLHSTYLFPRSLSMIHPLLLFYVDLMGRGEVSRAQQ